MVMIECGTPAEKEKQRKRLAFKQKCEAIAVGLLNNVFEEIRMHHGDTKLARGIAYAVVKGLHEIDYEVRQ